MLKLKILLAGTPHFSVSTFETIIQNFEVIAIISQPSKPVGRKKIITDPPVVQLAKKYQIPVFQPYKISQIEQQIKSIDFDLLITMAYGQIIPISILKLAKYGSYNIHASLLPRYRGAAPIQYALLNGDQKTGITFMEMVQKMDAGDILFQEEITINIEDNYDQLLERLSLIAQDNIVQWIINISNNNYIKKPQDETLVIFSPKISKEDEQLLLNTKKQTLNKIRALSSNPGAYFLDSNTQKRIKIFKATELETKNAIKIPCSDGILYGIEYQIEGKKKVSVLN